MKNTPETNLCPVCGKKQLAYMEICPICDWQNDVIQLKHPEWKGCANQMSLQQAREAYKRGKEVI